MVLINAVKDVAKALAELISATKCAAGKAADDPSMYQLKSAAKVRESETELIYGPRRSLITVWFYFSLEIICSYGKGLLNSAVFPARPPLPRAGLCVGYPSFHHQTLFTS